jgi:hypothetical protein
LQIQSGKESNVLLQFLKSIYACRPWHWDKTQFHSNPTALAAIKHFCFSVVPLQSPGDSKMTQEREEEERREGERREGGRKEKSLLLG